MSDRDLVTVYHGTSHAFRVEIEDYGLRSRPGLSRGVRVALRRELALVHGSAYAAYMMMLEHLPPKVLIATATIERSRIRDGAEENPLRGMVVAGEPVVGPPLVVPDGIRKDEILLEEITFKVLFEPAAARKALDLYERLTDRKVVLQDRRRS